MKIHVNVEASQEVGLCVLIVPIASSGPHIVSVTLVA